MDKAKLHQKNGRWGKKHKKRIPREKKKVLDVRLCITVITALVLVDDKVQGRLHRRDMRTVIQYKTWNRGQASAQLAPVLPITL